MRKIILAAIVIVVIFASCTKENTSVKQTTETLLFRAEGVSIDGTIQYSGISSVTITY